MSERSAAEIVSGVVRYYKSKLQGIRPLMKKLVDEGQKPHALVITCSDSRVVPNLVFGSEPGEIFVVRNIGNVVPPAYLKSKENSVGAAIEYALEVLKVPNIVIMGHSDCGAMKAVLNGKTGLNHVDNWLSMAENSLLRFKVDEEFGAGLPDHDRLSQINVLQQIESLRTYPPVAERIEKMSIIVHAWWFETSSGRVYAMDVRKNQFVPLEDIYPVLDPQTNALVQEIEAHFTK
jgi:carbonic anhydrase